MNRLEALRIYANELHEAFLHGETPAERTYCGELEDWVRSEMVSEELKMLGIQMESGK